MADANIRQVTEINPNGKYVVQFPEGTSDEVRKQMDELLEIARKENKNVYLEPGVQVYDLSTVAQAQVATPKPVEPKVEAPVETPKPVEQPVQQPVPQPVIPQQPAYVIDPNAIVMAQQPFQYAQNPQAQYAYNPLPQPHYVTGTPVQAPVYYPGAAPQGYGWVPNPQARQAIPVPQAPVYNPQFAEGPIGQHSAPLAQQPQQAQPAPRANASVQQPVYTLQPQQQ